MWNLNYIFALSLKWVIFSHLRRVKIPLSTMAFTLSGCDWEYVRARVEPQLPPNTTQLSTPRWLRSFSKSDTRSHVVFSYTRYNHICSSLYINTQEKLDQKNVYILLHVLECYLHPELSRGTWFPRSSLIHKNDAVDSWVEKPAMVGTAAATRTTVTERGK